MRLGDTSLVLEVEKDFTCYGDELVFGGGKVGYSIVANRFPLPFSNTSNKFR